MPLSFRRSYKARPGAKINQRKRRLKLPSVKDSRLRPPDPVRARRYPIGLPVGCAVLLVLGALLVVARLGVPRETRPVQASHSATAAGPNAETLMAAQVATLQAGTPTVPPSPSPTVAVPTSTRMAVPSATFTPSNPWAARIPEAACIRSDLPQEALVIGVMDGDTIQVRFEGDERLYAVRYIGVEAPRERLYYGTISKGKNAELLYYKRVTLVRDISDSDRLGTLLRYVMVDDTFVNFEMIAGGYAQALPSPPDAACSSSFESAQRAAQAARIGLWGAPAYLIPFSPTPPP